MPLVRIDALNADADRLDALGRAVHEALIDAIGIPPDDRFQVLSSHDGVRSTMRYDNFLGVQHDDDIVFVGITLRAGRTVEQKQALYGRIVELVEKYAGIAPRNVIVSLTENQLADWSFGDGLAQYVS